jgi:hypothetical protein
MIDNSIGCIPTFVVMEWSCETYPSKKRKVKIPTMDDICLQRYILL